MLKHLLLILIIFISIEGLTFSENWAHRPVLQDQLMPFSSDGCSNYPEGPFWSIDKNQWLSCCLDHDVKYWSGGTAEQRLEADDELRVCVAEKASWPAKSRANWMYFAVRLFGGPDSDKNFRWGYGWNFKRPYGPLNNEELEQVDHLYPENLDEITITNTRESKSNINIYPTRNGDYCLDEAEEYLVNHFGENVKIIRSYVRRRSVKIALDSGTNYALGDGKHNFQRRTILTARINKCEKEIRFDFGRRNPMDCKEPLFQNQPPKWIEKVDVPEECRQGHRI